MDLKEAVYTFIKSEEMKALRIKGGKPASMKVRVWRILQKYEKETGINLNIAISIKDNITELTKVTLEVTCGMDDGRIIKLDDLKKEESK